MQLFYRKYGSHPKMLLILHGLFGMSDNWVGIARKLSENFTVVVPDLRNHGKSPNSDEFSFELMVEDLDELLQNFKFDSISILGHSMGGKLAMKYCEIGQQEVQKLIVVDISMRNNKIREEHIAIINAINNTNLDICNSIKDIEMQVRINLDFDHLVLFVLKNIHKDEFGKYSWKMNLPGIEPNLPNIISDFSIQEVQSLPTMFIKGGDSDYIADEDIPIITTYFPMAKFSTIDDAGHWVHADKPNEFLKDVEGFLGEFSFKI